MALKSTPQFAAEKWARRLGSANADITNGVNSVTTAPGELAAQKQDKMLAGIQEAITSGRWARAVRAVPLETWKQRFINIGLPRIATGATAAIPKMQAHNERFFPFLEGVVREINTMPDATISDSIARVTAYINKVAAYKKV